MCEDTYNQGTIEKTVWNAYDCAGHGAHCAEIKEDPALAKKIRIGVLLANKAFAETSRMLSHVLWALFDVLPTKGVRILFSM